MVGRGPSLYTPSTLAVLSLTTQALGRLLSSSPGGVPAMPLTHGVEQHIRRLISRIVSTSRGTLVQTSHCGQGNVDRWTRTPRWRYTRPCCRHRRALAQATSSSPPWMHTARTHAQRLAACLVDNANVASMALLENDVEDVRDLWYRVHKRSQPLTTSTAAICDPLGKGTLGKELPACRTTLDRSLNAE